jgi:hypothetical protein
MHQADLSEFRIPGIDDNRSMVVGTSMGQAVFSTRHDIAPTVTLFSGDPKDAAHISVHPRRHEQSHDPILLRVTIPQTRVDLAKHVRTIRRSRNQFFSTVAKRSLAD